jgi:hypothetical protein
MSEIYFGRVVVVQKVDGTKISFSIVKPALAGIFNVDFADQKAVLSKKPTTVKLAPTGEEWLYCTEKTWSDLLVPISRHDPFDGGNKSPSGDSAGGTGNAGATKSSTKEEATPERKEDEPSLIMYAPVETVTLDLARDGDKNRDPLSSQIKYLALCGSHPSVQAELNLEHADVVDHLAKRIENAQERVERTGKLRSAVTRFLRNVDGWHRNQKTPGFKHLRLVFSPGELGLLPFELVQRDDSEPSLLMDESEQMILTREMRHGPRVTYRWPSVPRVLFAWAHSSAPVLFEDHQQQLERALEPWAKPLTDGSFKPDYGELLTTIDKARLTEISEEIERVPYTHVHLLAHGVPLNPWKDPSFGIALRGDDHDRPVVVRGQDILKALTASTETGPRYPSVVTLGSCDSAHMGDVAGAESSVAHSLHRKGLPFVMGLQFGINSKASARIFGEFYRRILVGEDPRISLFHARKLAGKTADIDDDWASLVAYASFPEDLSIQAGRNALTAVIGSLDAATAWADEAITRKSQEGKDIARRRADEAIARLAALEAGWKKSGSKDKAWRSEHLGSRGSAFKRRAELAHRWGEPFDRWLKDSRAAYRDAFDVDVSNHWVGVQSLAVTAMLTGNIADERQRWMTCEYVALLQANARGITDEEGERAWAHGSLVELYLLEPLLAPDELSPKVMEHAFDRAMRHLKELHAIGKNSGRYIPSTKRQLLRYANKWCFAAPDSNLNQLSPIAQRLLNQLDQL